MIQANGTDAKEIAIHFCKLNDIRITPHFMGRTMGQVKNLLSCGFTKDEIISAMDYAVTKKGVQMYSFGYMNASINDLLREVKEAQQKEEKEKQKEEVQQSLASQQACVSEVTINHESAERNARKAERFGVQSRFRKKYNFDMFEGQ